MAVKTVIISNNQSLFDIAIQELGNSEAFQELATINNLSPTARLVPGQVLIIPDTKLRKSEVLSALARYSSTGKLMVATASKEGFVLPEVSGIGEMIIESTLIVY